MASMTPFYTGIVTTLGRIQEYTVWVKGQVVYFTATRMYAEKILKAEAYRAGVALDS